MSTRSLAYWIALVGGAEIAWRGHLADDARLFHLGAWLFAGMLAGTAWRRRERPAVAAAAGLAALVPALLSLLAWAGIPVAETSPVAAFWEPHGLERRVLETPVRQGTVTLFGQEIPVDGRGFRMEPRPPEPVPDAFRIVALGGSTTFGATRDARDAPWPTRLQQRIDALACRRPVQVVNAGRLGLDLRGSLRDLEREILPLRPDLVVYYPSPQDITGLMGHVPADVAPAVVVPERASSLLRQLERRLREGPAVERFRAELRAEPAPLDLEKLPPTPTYRRLLLEMRREGVEVALATGSLAVDGDSPERRIRQLEALEPRTRRALLANRLHARFVRGMAARYRGRLIDTRPGLDGDEASFIDLFHLTDSGRQRLADDLFEALRPRLAQDAPGCAPPS